jgi:hypothetical protein
VCELSWCFQSLIGPGAMEGWLGWFNTEYGAIVRPSVAGEGTDGDWGPELGGGWEGGNRSTSPFGAVLTEREAVCKVREEVEGL